MTKTYNESTTSEKLYPDFRMVILLVLTLIDIVGEISKAFSELTILFKFLLLLVPKALGHELRL